MAQPSANTYLKTPQAVDDFFTLNLDSSQPRMLGNILSNDGGGKAKRLWSVSAATESDGDDMSSLLQKSDFSTPVQLMTDRGATVSIDALGNVTYTPVANLNCMDDSFSYAIRMANGTLSVGEVSIDLAPPGFYTGQLSLENPEGSDNVSATGVYNDFDPLTNRADYWAIELKAGESIVVEGARLEEDFDMSLWLFNKIITDPVTEFANGFSGKLDSNDAGFLYFADDEIEVNGPYGDPRTIIYTAATDQCITAIVTNYASGSNTGGDGAFDYMIGVQASV
jgi:Bacterial Ig domain